MSSGKHIISCLEAPTRWCEGFPIGNGVLGAMVWGDGDPLCFTIDHAELWDTRIDTGFLDNPEHNYASLRKLVEKRDFERLKSIFEDRHLNDNPVGPTKISIGRVELKIGKSTEYDCHLDIDRAVYEGIITTDNIKRHLTSFVHRYRNLLCLRIDPACEDCAEGIVPLAEMTHSLAQLNHPAPQIEYRSDYIALSQQIPEGPCYAVVASSNGPDFYIAVETSDTMESALVKAKQTWEAAKCDGFTRLLNEHTNAWKDFWNTSAVNLPEDDAELMWYYGIYLPASSAKKGYPPPGLQGLWAMDGVIPPWRGDYHADMNVQETFWSACASGHLDILDSWCDYMKACIEPSKAFTRLFFGSEGTFWPACTIPYFTLIPCWDTVQFGWSHSGWLGWLVWLRWRYSMDTQWLNQTGYPIISEIFKFYHANLELEDDGYLHVPLSSSPEYKENKPQAWCKDPNIDIALIRKCCDWIIEMESALKISELSDSAVEVKSTIVPYSTTTDGALCLWPGHPLDESHRHPSHLMAIHPAMDLTIDGDDKTCSIINASVEQYLSLGQYLWAGHTYAQMVSFAAVTGKTGLAYDCLRQFMDLWVAPNCLYFNRDLNDTGRTAFRGSFYSDETPPFTMESNSGISAGISDMLIQGWNDIVRVFPAIPKHWTNVEFHNLLTEQAFRVSAVRRNGITKMVKIESGTNRILRLKNPFGNCKFSTNGTEYSLENDLLVFDMVKGQQIVLEICDSI